MSEQPLVAEAMTWEAAQAELEEAGLGDGLPLVPPTARRLEAMLAGVADPDAILGAVPPLFGELTPRSVAYNALLAGCRPAERIVVETALTACLEGDFNLLGLMTTTGSAAVATVVHGPIVERLGLNASINCLGPGNRANAVIGRAVSLCLRNIGGATAGVGDMATCGQPGKYTFCFAEGGQGPFPPLHVRRGLAAGASAVTVLGVSGSAEVLPLRDGEGGDTGTDGILEALAIIMAASVATTGAARQPRALELVFVLPPELAARVVADGYDLARIQGTIVELAARHGQRIAASPDEIHPIVTGGPGVKMAYLPLWGGGSRMVTRTLA
ncbi:MAG: hypothetical protein SFW09_18245 [Hyphomicrobiaceae bacterium]|nr:hypothetical protein [Hyphomicrobiaceae bacterium]